jgi:hypothetical protein
MLPPSRTPSVHGARSQIGMLRDGRDRHRSVTDPRAGGSLLTWPNSSCQGGFPGKFMAASADHPDGTVRRHVGPQMLSLTIPGFD